MGIDSIHFRLVDGKIALTIFDELDQKIGRVRKINETEIGVVKISKEAVDFHVINGGDKPKRQWEIGPPVG
jgi:hypothetical protein